jgi:hypothetical protein
MVNVTNLKPLWQVEKFGTVDYVSSLYTRQIAKSVKSVKIVVRIVKIWLKSVFVRIKFIGNDVSNRKNLDKLLLFVSSSCAQ